MPIPAFNACAFPTAWRQHVQAWGDSLKAEQVAAATINGYALHLRWLAENVGADPWQITPDQVADWLDGHAWATLTRRKVLSSLRRFYTWALATGLTLRSPLAGIAAAPPRKSGPQPLPMPPAWEKPIRDWLIWLDARALSRTTQRTYLFHVRSLAEQIGDPWQTTQDDLARYLSRDDYAPETKKSARVALRGFFAWAEGSGHMPTNPAAGLPTVRVPRTMPRPASEAAVSTAFTKADDRTRLVLAIACYAGLRVGEISRLHTRDLNSDSIRVTGKGGHERLVPLHAELARLLRCELDNRRRGIVGTGWVETRPPSADGWLFPTVDASRPVTPGYIGNLISRVLPQEWTPHTLRHRFATLAYAAERDLRAVQELLGHASPNTTIRYAAVPTDSLRTAVASITGPALT